LITGFPAELRRLAQRQGQRLRELAGYVAGSLERERVASGRSITKPRDVRLDIRKAVSQLGG
jgi:hypothetical protein